MSRVAESAIQNIDWVYRADGKFRLTPHRLVEFGPAAQPCPGPGRDSNGAGALVPCCARAFTVPIVDLIPPPDLAAIFRMVQAPRSSAASAVNFQ